MASLTRKHLLVRRRSVAIGLLYQGGGLSYVDLDDLRREAGLLGFNVIHIV